MVGNIMLGMVKFMTYHIQIMETYHNDWTHDNNWKGNLGENSSYNGMYDGVYIYIYIYMYIYRFGYLGKHVYYIYMIWLIIWLYLKKWLRIINGKFKGEPFNGI